MSSSDPIGYNVRRIMKWVAVGVGIVLVAWALYEVSRLVGMIY